MVRYQASGIDYGDDVRIRGDLIVDDYAGIPRVTTFIVAAADSTTLGRAKADYRCNGTSDQDTINEAIDALPDTGGKVHLLEGTFVVDGAILVPSNVALQGSGNSTVLQVANAIGGAMNVIANSDEVGGNEGILICDFKIDGNKANNVVGGQKGIFLNTVSRSVVANIWIINTTSDGIVIDGNYNLVRGCLVESCDGDGSIAMGDGMYNRLVSNTIVSGGRHGFYIASNATDFNVIANNIVQSCARHGILLDSGDHNSVLDNLIVDCNESNGNFDGINITSGADYNNVQGNLVRKGAPSTRYGIRVDAGTTGNFVCNNDLHDAGATNNFSDAGTGTITAAGNRV